MSKSFNLSLTNELREYVTNQSGEGTDYSTPTEFVRGLIRAKKREDAETAAFIDHQLEMVRRLEELAAGKYATHESVKESILGDL